MCARMGRYTPAKVVDHIKPHKGDLVLFSSYNNTQSLCAHCHNSVKQSMERGYKHPYSKEIGGDGWPIDPKHPANK